MKACRVVYPGTFDPITLGHEEIIRRAALLFSHVTVAVAEGVHKNTYFPVSERVEMIQEVVADLSHVEVIGFSGLFVHLLKHLDTFFVVRGLRAVSDFEYEFQLAGMNRKLNRDIQTIFLVPDECYQFISSTIVREIASLGGDVSAFVNACLVQKIQQRCVQIRWEKEHGTNHYR